jgi:pyruvate/2-oxoglutarate dehydrogenase complex dihydrolipoamide dehydrogenase (E3) component
MQVALVRTNDLDLNRAGVATDNKGYITVDDFLATNVPGISWASATTAVPPQTAYNDFEIVAANLLDGKQRKVRDRRHASTDAGSSSASGR